MTSLRIRLLLVAAFTAVSVWWGLMFLGTHLPVLPHPHVRMSDKLQHCGAYLGLSFLLLGVLRAYWPRSLKTFLTPILIGAAYGAVDELTQLLVPNRYAELLDWAADVTGLFLGAAAFAIVDWMFLTVKPWAAQQPTESTSPR
jgi:VanZ family protein